MQAHVAGSWMKTNPALVEGKWGEGDKVCVLLCYCKLTSLTSFSPLRLRKAGQDFVVPKNLFGLLCVQTNVFGRTDLVLQ